MKKPSFSRRLRHTLREPLVKILVHTLSRVPLSANRAFGAWLGKMTYRFSKHSRHLAEVNLRHCFPELNARQREELARSSLIESGKALSELAPLWTWPMDKLLPLAVEVEGEEAFATALEAGKGAIVLAPHLGSWELGSWEFLGIHVSNRYPMTNMYRPPQIKALEPFMLAGRQRSGNKIVPTDLQGVRALIKALRQGSVIGILPDQDPGLEGGRFAPFFGVQANTMTLLSKIAVKTGAPVFTCYAERLPADKGYKVVFSAADAGIYSADEEQALSAMNAEVEKVVRVLPSQYQWSYHRFRSRPEGEPSLY
jgi:KDO2-lipid IV(A) lauroyltransferase